MNNLHIITVSTHSDYYFPYLIKSCKNNGKELTVLAYGEKWKGFNWRFKLVINYLKNINKNDIICFVDGFDVICTRNLNQLKDVFFKLKNKYNCKIIVGEHKMIVNNNFSSCCKILLKYYFGECKNVSLNAGTYIGQAKDLIEILETIYNTFPLNNADDQKLLTKYCLMNPDDIYIDVNNEIFLTLELPYQEIDKYIKFNKNGNDINISYNNNNNPFFIHGAGQTYLDNIIINLNYQYDYNNPINNELSKNFYKNILFRIKNSIFIIIVLIIIILIIIYILYKVYKYFIFKKMKKLKK
jgi:hypothetical protein